MRFCIVPLLVLFCGSTVLFGADPSAETVTSPPVAAVPAPVPGYPIGWCIRAKDEVFADAKSAGFEYVELALQDVLNLSDDDFKTLSAGLESRGLKALSGYNPIPKELRLVGPEANQAKLDEHFRRLFARASALKLTYIILNSGNAWSVPDGMAAEEAATQLEKTFHRLANQAEKNHLTLLLEPVRTTDSNLITSAAEALKWVERVNHPQFQMMVDYSFMTINKEDPATLLKAGPHLRHIHLSNPSANRTYPMDDHESNYAAFFSVLKQMHYRGALSVHASTKEFALDAPRAIRFLRSKAAELSETDWHATANDLTNGWTEIPLQYEIQRPYDLALEDRYYFDADKGTHLFWVNFTDKPHAPPPNKTTARTEMRLKTFSKDEHMFDADVYIYPGTFACIGQIFDADHGPVKMLIAHPDGTVTIGNDLVINRDAIGHWWNLKMTNDPVNGGQIRIYVDNVLANTSRNRGPRNYYFKCGVYSRKNSEFSKTEFRNIRVWARPSTAQVN